MEQLAGYSEFLIVVFSELLKAALDLGDLEQFQRFAEAARQVGRWSRTSLVDEVEHLEFRLASLRNEAQRQTILTELTRKRPLASKLGDIRRARRIAFLGLGAWITHMLDVGRESEAGFKAREQILAPELSDLSVVYDVFSAVQNDDRWDSLFHWGRWETREWPETYGVPQVGRLAHSDWIELYYVYRCLQLSPNSSGPLPPPVVKPTALSGQIAEYFDKQVKAIQESKIWRAVVVEPHPADFEARVAVLSQIHQTAKKQQERLEEEILLEHPIDAQTRRSLRRRYQEVLVRIGNTSQYLWRTRRL